MNEYLAQSPQRRREILASLRKLEQMGFQPVSHLFPDPDAPEIEATAKAGAPVKASNKKGGHDDTVQRRKVAGEVPEAPTGSTEGGTQGAAPDGGAKTHTAGNAPVPRPGRAEGDESAPPVVSADTSTTAQVGRAGPKPNP